MMRVAVVGLGGVGGYIAASFAKAGIDVTGFGRGEHLAVIQRDGIIIVEDEEQWSVHLNAKELREAEGIYDVVLFCVKSYDLQKSCEALREHINEQSVVLSFSNGVNNGDILRSCSRSRVLDGAVYILSHIEKVGVIRKKGKVFAAVFGGKDTNAVEEVAALFEEAGLRYKTPANIKEALWKKYIFIAAFASLTSYYDKPIKQVYEENEEEAKTLLREIAAVAKGEGVDIDEEVQKSLDVASKLPKDASSSMHLDFQNGKKSELESLSGFIAKKEGVDTPLMEKIYRTLLDVYNKS
ncbi:MAG: 2-dehydropantoate 2-reductase [Sulfurimonas sp.]